MDIERGGKQRVTSAVDKHFALPDLLTIQGERTASRVYSLFNHLICFRYERLSKPIEFL